MFIFNKVQPISGDDVLLDADAVRRALDQAEVIHFPVETSFQTDDELRGYYDQLVESVGTPIDAAEDFRQGGAPTGQRWSEIRYDTEVPDNVAFRFSKNPQPLHTDESYVSSGAGVMLFYCVTAAPTGGETVFVSGKRLVEHLKANEPELLERLIHTPVRYAKASDAKEQPIINISSTGDVYLNFNYYCADPEQSRDALQLNEDFHQYLENELPSDLVHPVSLKRGEAVTWRDSAVLHGRNGFEASTSGDRFIWKTGIRLEAAT